MAYFSPNGQTWQYAGTIDPAGGWRPNVVKGSTNGFVVTGTTSTGQIVAYTSTGSGGTWQPTGSLGQAATENGGKRHGRVGRYRHRGRRHLRWEPDQPAGRCSWRPAPAGTVRPVSLAAIAGGLVPELAVNGLATAGGEQIAVGSADGYPAVWRQAPGSGPWSLVSSLSRSCPLTRACPR